MKTASIFGRRPFTIVFILALFLAPPSAFAALNEFFSATGKLFLSADGAGSPNSSHIAQVEKPNVSATVRKAFVMAASIPNINCAINNGNVSINGSPITWDDTVANGSFSNVRADVTSIVKPIVDSSPAGRIGFTFTETNTSCIDGEALVVVFDDPAQVRDASVILLFGGQVLSGDTFAITLGEPIDPAAPGSFADMGLGISFGFQGESGPICGTLSSQFSIINVNNQRLTSCAGNYDDGQPADGALITVGGLDDLNDNPADPFQQAGDGQTPRVNDDELYSLLPLITAADTSISVFTQNPSNNDNIFFAYFNLSGAAVVGEGIVLSPASVSNPVDTEHTVTARVSDGNGEPVQGVLVTFDVISGPNAGDGDTDTTDTTGEATFTYTGDGGAGTDEIQASFVDSQNNTKTSNAVTKEWTTEEPTNTPPVAGPQSVTTPEDAPKTITLTGSDADNDALIFIIVTPPANGTLSAPSPATSAQQSRAKRQVKARMQKERKIPGTGNSSLRPKALAAIIQSISANTVTYTPDLNYNGPDSFTFRVNDGTVSSAPATVNITVTPTEDNPEIQNLTFARRDYSTPGIAALLEFRDIDGDFDRLNVTLLKARNLPKGCGPDVIASDEASIFPFSETRTDPDSDPTDFEATEIKAVEIGPDAMAVAAAHGCNITLEITAFNIRGVDLAQNGSNVLSGTFSIDSDGGTTTAAPLSNRLRSSSKAPKKITAPVFR